MLDPSLTNVLKQRIIASVIDLGIVGILTAAFARSQAEVFNVVERDPRTNEPIWSAEQFDRLVEISQSFNRTLDIGDTIYVLSGVGLYLTAAVAVLLTLLVWVLLPANTGWSPGKRILGLRVANVANGESAAPGQHVLRTFGGLIDGFPYVIPGLLGWLVAWRSRQHQRFGDRIAKTTVVDSSRGVRLVGDPAPTPKKAVAAVKLDDSMVDLDARLGSGSPDLLELGDPPVPTEPADGLPPRPLDSGPTPVPVSEETGTSPVDEPLPPPPTADAAVTPPPSTPDIDETPAPPTPVADETPPDLDQIIFDASSELTTAEPDPVDEPLASPMEPASLPLLEPEVAPSATESVAQPVDESESDADLAFPPPPTHRSERNGWDPPLAEPAPVWSPETEAHPEPEPAAVETEAHPEPEPEPAAVEVQTVPIEVDPQWNEEWQSWLFWDPDSDRWLRHDADANRWVPIG